MSGYAVSLSSSNAIFGDSYTFTVEAWYKNDGIDSGNNGKGIIMAQILYQIINEDDGDPYNNFIFAMAPENHGPTGAFNISGAYSSERYDDGHHVAGIIEKISDNSSIATLYVDGEYIAQNEIGKIR